MALTVRVQRITMAARCSMVVCLAVASLGCGARTAIVSFAADYRGLKFGDEVPISLPRVATDARAMTSLLGELRHSVDAPSDDGDTVLLRTRVAPTEGGLFYFSGHCVYDSDKADLLLVFPPREPRPSIEALSFAALSQGKKNWTWLLDCCNSGLADVAADSGSVVVAAGNADVAATSSGTMSPFTSALIDGFATGEIDENCDGAVTAAEVAEYIDERSADGATPGRGVVIKQGRAGDPRIADLGPAVRSQWLESDRCRGWRVAQSEIQECISSPDTCPGLRPIATQLAALLDGRDAAPLGDEVWLFTADSDAAAEALSKRLACVHCQKIWLGRQGRHRDVIRWLPSAVGRFAPVLLIDQRTFQSGRVVLEAIDVMQPFGRLLCLAPGADPRALLPCLDERRTGVEIERFSVTRDATGKVRSIPVLRFDHELFDWISLTIPDCPPQVQIDRSRVTRCDSRRGRCVNFPTAKDECLRRLFGAARPVLRRSKGSGP